MKTLEREAAMDYLTDLRSVVQKFPTTGSHYGTFYKPPRSFVDFMTAMVDVEINLTQRVIDGDEKTNALSPLVIGPHGFPDLLPWLVDAREMLVAYDRIMLERTYSVERLINSFEHDESGQFVTEVGVFVNNDQVDEAFIKTFESLNASKKDIVAAAGNKSNRLPLRNDSGNNPYILVYGTYGEYYFQPQLGIKYIERSRDERYSRRPAILVFELTSDAYDELTVVLPDGVGQKSDFFKIPADQKLTQGVRRDRIGKLRANDILESLKILLIETDMTSLSDADINNFLLILPFTDRFLTSIREYFSLMLDTNEASKRPSIIRKAQKFVAQKQAICGLLEDAGLRLDLNSIIAEYLAEFSDRITSEATRIEKQFQENYDHLVTDEPTKGSRIRRFFRLRP